MPGVLLLRWIGDTLAFDEFLTVRQPGHVVIVGGGYIGLEMAEALRTRGVEVTIVEMAPAVSPWDPFQIATQAWMSARNARIA